MPFHGGEHRDLTVVPYVGYRWRSGWHAAAGYDPHIEKMMTGGGYRVNSGGVGLNLAMHAHDDELTFGAGLSIEFDSLF